MAKQGKGITNNLKTDEHKQKIRESMLGKLNAEYWTEKVVTETLFAMIEILQEEYEVIRNTKDKSGEKGDFEFSEKTEEKVKRRMHTKTSLLLHFGIINMDFFSDMGDKFDSNTTILRMLKAINDICQTNVYEDAANGAVNAGVASLLLQSKYDWKTRSESDNTNKGFNVNIELPKPTDEALKRWQESQIKNDE